MAKTFQPRLNSQGRICCSDPAGLCDKCKRHHATARSAARLTPPDPYRIASDQAHLDAAATHLAQAGATVPDDVDDATADDLENNDPMTASARLVAASRRIVAARGYGSVVTSTPNPYEPARRRRNRGDPQPSAVAWIFPRCTS
jgi:hypothetical protein